MSNWVQTQIQFQRLTDERTEHSRQTNRPAMLSSSQLDEDILAIINCPEFHVIATGYLRKKKRYRDTAIGTSEDKDLKHLAWKFCIRHLDKIFPDIRQSGIPDPNLIYREVCKMYCELKVEIMDRATADQALSPMIASEPIMPSQLGRSLSPSSSITHTSMEATSTTSTRRSKRRARPAWRKRPADNRPVIVDETTHSTTDNGQETSSLESHLQMRDELSDTILGRQESRAGKKQKIPLFSIDRGPIHNLIVCQCNQDALVDELSKQNEDLQIVNRRLECDNHMLVDYRNFVHYTLRLCQDTWLEEGNSAKAARLVQPARESEKVVEAFRDVLSDIDFQYFSDYHRLHKCAPPSRYWLDSVRSHRSKEKPH